MKQKEYGNKGDRIECMSVICKRKNRRKIDQILRQDFLAIVLIRFFDFIDAISFVD
jgi:hypothetical protein